jgi:hypothetical protein
LDIPVAFDGIRPGDGPAHFRLRHSPWLGWMSWRTPRTMADASLSYAKASY